MFGFVNGNAFMRRQSVKLVWFSILILVGAEAAQAQAFEVLIAPTRVVFDGTARTKEVVIVNRSAEPEIYDIGFENKRFNEEGEATTVTEANTGEKFADNMLKVSSHTITVAPGESQVVRILLRKLPGLETGEYRTHLVVRGQPKEDAPIVTGGDAQGVSVKLIPIYGLSIPILVRQGSLASSVAVTEVKLSPPAENGTGRLELYLTRTGDRSAFVDISLYSLALPKGAAPTVALKGLSIYAPLSQRHVQVQLSAEQMSKLRVGGNLLKWQEVDALSQPIGPAGERPL
jgi:P pilus assembly chaperone PapD